MNIELIKKYKKEFDSWLDDKSSIIMGYNISKTLESEIEWLNFIDWTFDRGIFILNDEYVKFRKALAEGKIIQCNAREGQNDITYAAFGHRWWVDVTEFKYATRFYRIKPEDSDKPKITKFKVGDWVHIPALDSVPCQFSEDLCMLGLEKWEPQSDEWCWNYVFGLVKVICKTKTEGHFLCWNPWKRVEQTITIDEPFIGTLPTKLGKK